MNECSPGVNSLLHMGHINVWWVNYHCNISSCRPGPTHAASWIIEQLLWPLRCCWCLCFARLPGRTSGPRGPPGPGPMPNYNRSTEDLRLKQQPANYGRLRRCPSAAFQCTWKSVDYCREIFSSSTEVFSFVLILETAVFPFFDWSPSLGRTQFNSPTLKQTGALHGRPDVSWIMPVEVRWQ